jgi:hypothetical protein
VQHKKELVKKEIKLKMFKIFEPSKTYGLFTKRPGEEWYFAYGIEALSRKKAVAKFKELYGPDLDNKEWKVCEISPRDCKILSDEEFIQLKDQIANNRASWLKMHQEIAREREQQIYDYRINQ